MHPPEVYKNDKSGANKAVRRESESPKNKLLEVSGKRHVEYTRRIAQPAANCS